MVEKARLSQSGECAANAGGNRLIKAGQPFDMAFIYDRVPPGSARQCLTARRLGSRSGYMSGKGGNNQGAGGAAMAKLTLKAKSASGVQPIVARIAHLESLLAERAADD